MRSNSCSEDFFLFSHFCTLYVSVYCNCVFADAVAYVWYFVTGIGCYGERIRT